MAKTCRIANGAGFLGDNLDAPRLLVEAAKVDYLTLEYLAELTLSILARAREKDPQAGFAADFLDVLASLGPALTAQPRLRIVTNAGGMNPISCGNRAGGVLHGAGLGESKIAIVTGDDIVGRLAELQAAGCKFENLDTGQPLSSLKQPIVSANVYLGARPIVDALAADARIVITGRVADASLTLGPAVHAFGWSWTDWNRLAGGSVAGHLIECGAQVTGACSTRWENLDLANVGYPIAEVADSGDCVITKPDGSGGVVDRGSVIEQLVYEIGDPQHYLTPDVDVDFTTVEVAEAGPDRVAVRGATGRAAPDTLKVSLAYRAGYSASGELLVRGRDCLAKARACAHIILERVARAGFTLHQFEVEYLGSGETPPAVRQLAPDPPEVVLRVTAHDPRREAVERFTKEFAPLITSGPAGLAGYASGRPSVRTVFAYWPTLVPRDAVRPRIETRTAREWADATMTYDR
jgi:hypothetical protein